MQKLQKWINLIIVCYPGMAQLVNFLVEFELHESKRINVCPQIWLAMDNISLFDQKLRSSD